MKSNQPRLHIKGDGSPVRVVDAQALPMKLRVKQALEIASLSRNRLYDEAAKGTIQLQKMGRTTLVDTESLLAFLRGLPPAAVDRRQLMPASLAAPKLNLSLAEMLA